MDYLAHRGWIESRLSRKIIHTGTGPLFVMCWVLFKNTWDARYLAALVPLLITIQFFLIGIGVINDPASVNAMSRTGDRREILKGPLFYGIIFVVLTIIFWLDSPVGIIALMQLCGGDGIAEILGRRYGRSKIPWNPGKSWIGTSGMFLGGFSFSIIMVGLFTALNFFPGSLSSYLIPVTLISIACTLTETLPFRDIDNISISLVATIMGLLIF
jgi:phytol kinase